MTDKRTVIITGANSGIGFRAGQMLADKDYHVILACRNEQRAKDAVKRIKDENPEADVSYQLMELGDLASVKRFAEWFLSTGQSLHALVNNAGLMMPDGPRQLTKDGHESTFGVCHLGHFLLTMMLLDKLKSTAAETGQARIVNVSSLMHSYRAFSQVTGRDLKPVDFDDIHLENPDYYNNAQAYVNGKAANIMFTKALTRSLEGSGVVANAMCPGFVPETEGFRHAPMFKTAGLQAADHGYLTVSTVDDGGQHIVDLVDDPKFKDVSGIFYSLYNVASTIDEVNDEANQNRLWMISCDILGRNDLRDLLKQ